jgi:glucose-1-phosphate cytidylyltransferase
MAIYSSKLTNLGNDIIMEIVLLAGGLGTRIREETEIRPKPMIEIGGEPLLWHLINYFKHFNHKDFIICAGYKKNVIQDYFFNFEHNHSDFTKNFGENKKNSITYHKTVQDEWNVTIADTGALTPTGGRLKKIEKYIKNDIFLATYGDGLADIDISVLLEFHHSHGKIATVTAVKPNSRFGLLDIDAETFSVKSFKEKTSDGESWINAGFFVFNREIFDFLEEDSILEHVPLESLAKANQLVAFKHEGFWQPMDTFREWKILNELWEGGKAPWKKW